MKKSIVFFLCLVLSFSAYSEQSVVVLASAETISPASNVIDNNPSTMWSTAWNRNLSPAPVWLQFDYTTPQVFNQMSITFNVTTSVGRAPQAFIIQGSNDGGVGGNWTDLNAQTQQSFTSGETKVYSFVNINSYRYYRLYITTAYTTSAIEVSEIAFSLVTTVDAPTITTSSEAAGLPATNVIDGLTSTNWKSTSAPTVAAPQWLQLQYSSPQTFNKVTITSCAYNNGEGYSSRDPRDWTIEGSNDATTWTILDTQNFSLAEFPHCWVPKDDETQHEVPKQFSFTNTTAYTYYRMKITLNNQSSSSVMLSEIEFSGILSGIEKKSLDNIRVYAQMDEIIVDLNKIGDDCTVNVFDIRGINLASKSDCRNGKHTIGVKSKGIYLVRIEQGNDVLVQKVIVK